MTDNHANTNTSGEIEVRAFNFLKKLFDQRNWSYPHIVRLENPCSAAELAERLDLPADKIEAVFINGRAMPLEDGWINPGDRVAFLPPGTPGPHRFLLGIAKLPDQD